MFDYEILRKCLDSSIKINKLRLSYVARMFPEFEDTSCIILYKEKASECIDNITKCYEPDQTSQFDVTGSPLKYSFGGEKDFEDTMIILKQYYNKIEETYLPLTRTEACNALNACIDFIRDSCPPIFALCDGKDKKDSRLLGAIIEGDWFTTIEVCATGIETFESIKKSSSKILEEHIRFSHASQQDINISTFTIFDLFGTKEEMINWDNNIKSNFEGSLSVEVDSCSLSFYPPSRASKNNLVAQIAINTNISPLKELWKQLLLLDQYLNILQAYTKNVNTHYSSTPLEFPKDFTCPYEEEHDAILTNINLLLNGDYSFGSSSDSQPNIVNFIDEQNVENEIKIEKYIQSLPRRYNLDFTDYLWELLIKNSSYFEITKCIHKVLEETVMNGCLPQVNFTNATRFAKIITNSQQSQISHLLSGSLPLQYVIDMGLEKLCKDYLYILMNTRFGDLQDIQEKLRTKSSTEFSIETYRNKLLYIAQIHVCLEFMLLLQDNLECPSDDLRTLFSYTFRRYVGEKSSIKDCCDLYQYKIYTLTAPLPISVVTNLSKEIPSIQRVSLSSQSKLSKLTTIKYFSQLPIFPTTIYPLEDSNEAAYYVTSTICSSNKFK